MTKHGLRSEEVLKAVQALTKKRGYSPTRSEIARYVGIERSTVIYHLNQLKKQDRITWEPNQPRTIRIIKEQS